VTGGVAAFTALRRTHRQAHDIDTNPEYVALVA
jgi:hypothetical protein